MKERKNKILVQLSKLAVSGMVLVNATNLNAGDGTAAHISSPEHYQKIIENEHVLKMMLKPGQSDRSHSHANETVYFEQGGKLKITPSESDSFEVTIQDGHVMWHPAWSHQVTNTGDTEVIAIIVEQKRQ